MSDVRSSNLRTPCPARARCSRWLRVALFCALSGCGREPGHVSTAKLPLTAALPTEFPSQTKLRIGDPKVQQQLTLSGLMGQLPFAVGWQNISGGPQTLEAFRAGALDAGAVGDTPPIHAAFTGLDVKIIAVQIRDIPTFQLALAPATKVTSLADLRGKKIAYSPGQAQGALVLRVLKKAGLQTRDVTLIELNSTEFKDALSSRQVDVAPLSGPILRRYLSEQRAAGARAIPHGTRDSISFLYVRTSVLEDPAKAAALRAYVRLRTQAQLWAANHAEQWLEFYYVKDQGLRAEDARAVIEIDRRPRFPADWSEVMALTQETIDLLAAATGRPTFEAKRLFDLRFQSLAAELASVSGTTAQR
jgi:sulfonate transport system substrate-binding protein